MRIPLINNYWKRLQRRRHDREAEDLVEQQLRLLWPAAHLPFVDKDQQLWGAMIEASALLARLHVRGNLIRNRAVWTVAMLVLAVVVAALLCLMLPKIGFAPLFFQPATPYEEFFGRSITLIVGGLGLGFGMHLFPKIVNWFQPFTHSTRLPLTITAAGAIALMSPALGMLTGWLRPPAIWFLSAAIEGMFLAGLFFWTTAASVYLLAFFFALRYRREVIVNARETILATLLRAFDSTLLHQTSDPRIMIRTVDAVLPSRRIAGRAATIVTEIRSLMHSSTPTELLPASLFRLLRCRLYREMKTPEDLPAFVRPLHRFLEKHLREPKEPQWPHGKILSSTSKHLRDAGERLVVLAQHLQTGEKARDEWIFKACQERARYITDLQNWALLPRIETRDALQRELAHIISLVARSDWGSLPRTPETTAAVVSWWRRTLGALKSFIVAVAPLAGVVTLGTLGKLNGGPLANTLWTITVGWLVINVLTGLDSRFSEKLALTRDLGTLMKGRGEDKS